MYYNPYALKEYYRVQIVVIPALLTTVPFSYDKNLSQQQMKTNHKIYERIATGLEHLRREIHTKTFYVSISSSRGKNAPIEFDSMKIKTIPN